MDTTSSSTRKTRRITTEIERSGGVRIRAEKRRRLGWRVLPDLAPRKGQEREERDKRPSPQVGTDMYVYACGKEQEFRHKMNQTGEEGRAPRCLPKTQKGREKGIMYRAVSEEFVCLVKLEKLERLVECGIIDEKEPLWMKSRVKKGDHQPPQGNQGQQSALTEFVAVASVVVEVAVGRSNPGTGAAVATSAVATRTVTKRIGFILGDNAWEKGEHGACDDRPLAHVFGVENVAVEYERYCGKRRMQKKIESGNSESEWIGLWRGTGATANGRWGASGTDKQPEKLTKVDIGAQQARIAEASAVILVGNRSVEGDNGEGRVFLPAPPIIDPNISQPFDHFFLSSLDGAKVNVHLLIKNRASREESRELVPKKYNRKGKRKDCGGRRCFVLSRESKGGVEIFIGVEGDCDKLGNPAQKAQSKGGITCLPAWAPAPAAIYVVSIGRGGLFSGGRDRGCGCREPKSWVWNGSGNGDQRGGDEKSDEAEWIHVELNSQEYATVKRELGGLGNLPRANVTGSSDFADLQIEKQREAREKQKGSETEARCRPIQVPLGGLAWDRGVDPEPTSLNFPSTLFYGFME
ncbi:hypothetical protein CPB86DRAFT_792708 [Serendipita vermifera]|nr:hypothetical protein CPB86DRAFT_792708 [Serendipita vermifera]